MCGEGDLRLVRAVVGSETGPERRKAARCFPTRRRNRKKKKRQSEFQAIKGEEKKKKKEGKESAQDTLKERGKRKEGTETDRCVLIEQCAVQAKGKKEKKTTTTEDY